MLHTGQQDNIIMYTVVIVVTVRQCGGVARASHLEGIYTQQAVAEYLFDITPLLEAPIDS